MSEKHWAHAAMVPDGPRGTIAYIIHDGVQNYLCVMDDANGAFHRFPVTVVQLARIAAESAKAVNSAVGGYNAP